MPKLNRQNAIHFIHYAVWSRGSFSSRREKKRKYIVYRRRDRKKAGCSSLLNGILHPIKKGPQLIHFFSVFRIISMPFIPRILIISIRVSYFRRAPPLPPKRLLKAVNFNSHQLPCWQFQIRKRNFSFVGNCFSFDSKFTPELTASVTKICCYSKSPKTFFYQQNLTT